MDDGGVCPAGEAALNRHASLWEFRNVSLMEQIPEDSQTFSSLMSINKDLC